MLELLNQMDGFDSMGDVKVWYTLNSISRQTSHTAIGQQTVASMNDVVMTGANMAFQLPVQDGTPHTSPPGIWGI